MTFGVAGRNPGDDIKIFLRKEILNGNPQQVLKRLESTTPGSELISRQRKVGSGWESMIQALLLGFLDRCDNVREYKELAETMGVVQDNWKCHCGNDNYWYRLVCNRRHCKAPKHGSLSSMSAYSKAGSMFSTVKLRSHMGGRFAVPFGSEDWRCLNCDKLNLAMHGVCSNKGCNKEHPQAAGLRDKNGERIWVCKKCSNKNWISRDVCNMKHCDQQRPNDITLTSRYLPNGDWECGKCGNLNFASRTVCNRQTCTNPAPTEKELRMQHPWVCPKCNNVNYAERMVCNRKTCESLRPEDGGERPAQELPSGEWICSSCNNLNFASRVLCNNNRCKKPNFAKRKPGDWICPSCQNVNWGLRTECNMPNCDTKRPARKLENGNWECSTCGNLNFGHREVCNITSCQETRPEWATEMFVKFKAEQDVSSQKRQRSESDNQEMSKKAKIDNSPDGSWICPACSNLNYPQRKVCNKRTCKAPRPVLKDMEENGKTDETVEA